MQSTTKDKINIGILGGGGLLGSDLVFYLKKKFIVDAITRENYKEKKGSHYKFFINANGNSKRFWANQNPMDDFLASTVSVYKSIFDFPSDFYMYISSPDVYENHSSTKYTREEQKINSENLEPYGLNKYLSELIVKKYKEKFLILRCSMILGKNLKKGPLYDIFQVNPLFIKLQSKIQFITTTAIAEIIEALLQKSVICEIVNVGGIGSFSFTNIYKYHKKNIKVSKEAQIQFYEMNVDKLRKLFPTLTTSENYLREFLASRV